jgi:hypothetical protein
MTTYDLWITDLSGGPSLDHHGYSALDVAMVLTDFINSGKATADPEHDGITNVETTIGGIVLLEAFAEVDRQQKKRYGGQSTVGDDTRRRTSESVTPEHSYNVRYLEF